MDFSARSTLTEWMDTEEVDTADFGRCLTDLATVNTVTLARRPTLDWLDRVTAGMQCGATFSILDVACGHGDMLRAIRRWAEKRSFSPVLTGIDLNPSSRVAAEAATPRGMAIRYETADVFEWRADPAPDFIVSALFTHHLQNADVVRFLQWMQQTAARGWFVNDLHRHPVPYYGFRALAETMRWHRFVRHDGPVSIARAFVPSDWTALLRTAGVEASVQTVFPFRLCVSHPR